MCLLNFYHNLPLIGYAWLAVFPARHGQNFFHGTSNTANMHKVLHLQKKEPTKHCMCHATTLSMSEANINNEQVLRVTRQKNEPKHKQMHSTNTCTQQAHSRENTHTCYPSPYSHVFLNWITKPDFLTCHQTQCHIRGKWQNQHFCGFSFPFFASSFASSCRSGSLSRNKQRPKQGSKNCWASLRLVTSPSTADQKV